MKRLKLNLVLLLTFMFASSGLWAQSVPITISNNTQVINGKSYYVYVTQQGQTLVSIARAYGLHYSAAVLKTDIHSLVTGDTVWLPVNDQSRAAVSLACGSATAPTIQTTDIVVEQGQTLYSLSKLYNTSVEQILDLNPMVKTDGLKTGQTIKLPATHGKTTSTPDDATTPKTKTSTSTNKTKSAAIEPAQKQPAVVLSVRPRISPDKVHITIMMPLYLDKLNEISTTKFDVDQRGKKSYQSFEFIQFYEGVLLGLDELEKQGISVVLNVVDLTSEDDDVVANALNNSNVINTDLVIALLTRKPFQKAAELAKQNRVFIVSPMSTRDEILDDNPYVVKYMPSNEAITKAMLDVTATNYPGSHLYILHSKSRSEAPLYDEFTKQLQTRTDIKYTFFNWTSSNGKLVSTLKSTRDNVVVSIYDQGRDKNRIYSNLLLNRLSSITTFPPTLMTDANYIRDFTDVDYNQLQTVNDHTIYTAR